MSPVSNYRGTLHAGNTIDVTLRSAKQQVATGHLALYSITPAEPGPAWASRYRPTNYAPANDGITPPPADPAQ